MNYNQLQKQFTQALEYELTQMFFSHMQNVKWFCFRKAYVNPLKFETQEEQDLFERRHGQLR